MIRILSILTGAAGVVLFVLPVFTGRIVNIGNVTGLAVSTCLLACGTFQDRIHALLQNAWTGGTAARVLLAAVGAVLAGIVLTALVLTCLMVRAAQVRPSPDAAVVVLGCEVKGERPSRMLAGRIDAALSYMRNHPDAVCVASGGKGEGEKISEAECIFRGLTAGGISPDRILLEERSESTRENLLFSMRVLEEAGSRADAGGAEDQKRDREIAVVTNEFHLCRAQMIARSLGISAGSVPAPSPWWLLPTFYVRELYGLLYQILL